MHAFDVLPAALTPFSYHTFVTTRSPIRALQMKAFLESHPAVLDVAVRVVRGVMKDPARRAAAAAASAATPAAAGKKGKGAAAAAADADEEVDEEDDGGDDEGGTVLSGGSATAPLHPLV